METKLNFKNERLVFRGQTLSVSTPIVMGILNLTPDSFSDGGSFPSVQSALNHAEKMIHDGASILDLGGESARPGAETISLEEEKKRVIPVLRELVKSFPKTFFSIDTTKYELAKMAFDEGAHILNDISGLQNDLRFVDLCESYETGLVIMHSKGNPKTMQQNPVYADVMKEIKEFFNKRLQKTESKIVGRIIIDPGFGFGKTVEHNFTIAQCLAELTDFGIPVMVGASRKSFIGKILNDKPVNERLIGTVAFHYDNLIKGAKILRVHDVNPAFESILMYNAITKKTLS